MFLMRPRQRTFALLHRCHTDTGATMTDPRPDPLTQPDSPTIPAPEVSPGERPDEAPPIDPGVEQPDDPRPHDQFN